MRVLAPLVVALALAAVASTPAQTANLFPVAAGNHWTLRDAGSGLTKKVAIEHGVTFLELYGFPGLTDGTGVRRKGSDVQVWDASRHRWVTLLRFGAAGTRFRVDLAGETLWRSVEVTVESTTAVVRDARGRVHRGCTRFSFRYRGLADAGLTDLTFAPGVGLVRVSQTSFTGPHTSLLVSARVR